MTAFARFIRIIPRWAFLLVFSVLVVNSLYLFFHYKMSWAGTGYVIENGQRIITNIDPGSPAEKAGLRIGDVIKSYNSTPAIIDDFRITKYLAGETVSYRVERDQEEISAPVILESEFKNPGFFLVMYVLIILVSISSLYLLYKKPGDPAVRIFFIYIQLCALCSNMVFLDFQNPWSVSAVIAFVFGTSLIGPALIHFHLLFPRRSTIYIRFKRLPLLLYGTGILVAMILSVIYLKRIYLPSLETLSLFVQVNRFSLFWTCLTFALALAVVIHQTITIKNTLARNQLRIVFIGSLFVFIMPMAMALFYDQMLKIFTDTFLFEYFQNGCTLITIGCFLIAIFRYRIWNTGIFIRKALLYLGATGLIILSYLLLIYLVDLLTTSQTNLTRFLILAVSVVIFLVFRDRIQRLIDRFFHRESYDSATVVSDFEEKLAGIYRFDALKPDIVKSLDEIFHFKSFVFNLKKSERVYEPAFALGTDTRIIGQEFTATPEFERMLEKTRVFSPDELSKNPAEPESLQGDLIVPLIAGDQPTGFFVCGAKQSERTYSLQDIRILSLLAKRVVALLHTASLYQKDLERQLLLERERARISQDMHDDIGAGLTKIAMISESKSRTADPGAENTERMSKVASTAREMITSLNVIVWALNPQFDNLASLIAYLRRYFGEYLDNFGIRFTMDIPEVIPEIALTPDFRRNVFYAIQEAIHNAVKHGKCSEIRILTQISQKTITLSVADNGRGFDPGTANSFGNGLKNMKARAEDMGGSFEIQSTPGEGTRVGFTLRLG